MAKSQTIAQDVVCIPTGISNAYLLGTEEGFVLVDSGTAGNEKKILRAVRTELGKNATPCAIVLTHGHFDHSGSALELARRWGVRIYVHRRELPFVDGRECYPPADPTVGGFLAQMMRFAPNHKIDLSPHVTTLRLTELPWIAGWRILETPGHSPGHISLFRPADGTLIAGDAFATVDLDSASAVVSKRPQVSRPPAAFTPDWQNAERSVRRLAELDARVLAAGHGVPMFGFAAQGQLRDLSRNFPVPFYGRYTKQAAVTDENGIISLPEPVPDRLRRKAVFSAAAAGAVGITFWVRSRRSKRSRGAETRWEQVA
ncbi:MAG TPA: MBL fold metallo-hydrolase [Candidatus Angelobacter sp.]|nr:MBL fold metallo-hydrolase [Candidatus Angelobacter sp.]